MAYTVVAGDLRGDVTEDIRLATFGEVFVQGSPGAIFVAGTFSGQYGTLVLDASGLWTYTIANTLAVVQALGAGDVVQDAFVATSYLGDTIVSDFIEIAVAGANDPATIGGVLTATLDASATDTVSGQAVVLDIDDGEKEFQAGAAIAGVFGTLQVSKSGLWTYSLSPASRIALLDYPKTVTEVFTLSSADGMTSPLTVSPVAPGPAPTPGPIAMIGTEAADTLSDASGAATLIQGLGGDDTLHGGAGDDTLDGGAGVDVATYSLGRAAYLVERQAEGAFRVTALQGDEGVDGLSGIERLQFADGRLALDLAASQPGGQAVLAMGVLLPAGLSNPALVGAVLSLADTGLDAAGICQWLDDQGILAALAGARRPADIAAMAARNVLRSEPAAEVVDLLASYMDGRVAGYTPAQFLGIVAGLELNQMAVDLVGLQATGVAFE